MMTINNEILEYIDKSDFDDDVKKFIKQGLDLEERRMLVKQELDKNTNFFNRYDKVISKLLGV